MKHIAPRIGLAQHPRGILVSLPARFWLLVSLRRAVRRILAAEEAWSYLAPAEAALRLEQWIAEVELQLAADLRRRSWLVDDAEWNGANPAVASPAPAAAPLPGFVVELPSASTTKGTLKLLAQLEGGQILVSTPPPGLSATGRIFVLRPSGTVVQQRIAQRAIADRLVMPGGDGLFGLDTSQTWFLPHVHQPEIRP